MNKTTTTPAWRENRERGALIGILVTAWAYRLLGRTVAESILWFVVTYFFLTSKSSRQASFQFLRQMREFQNLNRAPKWTDVHRHFIDFAKTSLDRMDVWTGNTSRYGYTFQGKEHLEQLVSSSQGALLFGAHFGNSDVLRALPIPPETKVHFLTDQRGSKNFFSVLKRFCPRMLDGVHEYDPQRPEMVLSLKEAIERGEFVGLMADRIVSDQSRRSPRILRIPFLGKSAIFPEAPFLFSVLLGCPILFIAGLRQTRWKYELVVDPIGHPVGWGDAPRKERDEVIYQLASSYAKKLEKYCVRYPSQWFNFFDFWRTSS
ncbi:MAG: hypothetical protein JNK54_07920 [Elusimicrobia bacterium]|jgi:predicted LPLAT superfamily acyltransferase|nr:hypothetical protein [Elusimicrobiota bacterium]